MICVRNRRGRFGAGAQLEAIKAVCAIAEVQPACVEWGRRVHHQRRTRDDAGSVKLVHQSWGEFAVLFVWGVLMAGTCIALVLNFRGWRVRYAESLVRTRSKPLYQRVFLWTKGARRHATDVRSIQRVIAVVAGLGFVMALALLVVSLTALMTGNVS